MNSADGASSRPEPPGEGKESWAPKEPNRPLLPKPWAFGMSYSKPMDDLPIAGKKSADPMPEPPPEIKDRYLNGKWDNLDSHGKAP